MQGRPAAKRASRGPTGAPHSPPLQVAILVPFRNRHEHLPVLLRHLIPMLQRQRLRFAFYVVEQVSGLSPPLPSPLPPNGGRRSGLWALQAQSNRRLPTEPPQVGGAQRAVWCSS